MDHNYLKNHLVKKGDLYTHTRIPDTKKKISGGTYNITDLDAFYANYYKNVIIPNKYEYLTEKQLEEDGPILIDIDLRYDTSISTKQHTDEQIIDVIQLYLDTCASIVEIPEDTIVDVFIMEKKSVNMLDDKTKDGIHIIIGLAMHKNAQILLRKKVLLGIQDIWDELPITNNWAEVLDEGITKGCVNWQLYGSRKPNNEAYALTKYYKLTMGNDAYSIEDIPLKKFDLEKNFHKLTARNNRWDNFPIRDDAMKELEQPKRKTCVMKPNEPIFNKSYDQINSMEILDSLIEDWLENLTTSDYILTETYQYTMSLPSSYYGPGSYSKWIRVGWALASTHPRMFLVWLKFSAQKNGRQSLQGRDGQFEWNNVAELFEMWQGFAFMNPDGLTHRSIMYWCKNDARDKFYEIQKTTIDYYINKTLQKVVTEWDIATVLYNLYKDRFICVNVKNNFWYEYKNGRWYENDSGNSLRLAISSVVHNEYLERLLKNTKRLSELDDKDPEYNNVKARGTKMTEICTLLKKTQWKNNIMREAREQFYDKDFISKIDENPYLICFNNFVIDFKAKTHRKGQPDDYISKCTNIDYVKLNEKKHGDIINDINEFIEQLFPNKELRDYMWEHLASVLIGTNENQTFNIYTGGGSNGKSKLVDLMSKGLGDYKGTVPITLITQNRTTIGSTSSEIVQLMGKRYAVMQEPSKGDKINEGIMKEITGGDPIQGRALFKDTVTFIPQFKLVVCTNTLFDIKSNDDGTWRRIRVCDFMSKFLDAPYNNPKFPKEVYPHQFEINKNIDRLFDKWAPVFMSMLVEKAYINHGNVDDCDIVLGSSIEYREGQDYLAEFIKEKIHTNEGGKIKKMELTETFKQWYTLNYGRGVPKARELYTYMDKRFGAFNAGWHNISIVYDDEDVDE